MPDCDAIYAIYCITNTVNGKKYVGQTRCGVELRWRQHCNDAENGAPYLLHRAIRKYGEAAFTHALIEDVVGLDAANAAEELWISYFDSTNLELGYNLKAGGNVAAVHPTTKAKMSASQRAHAATLSPEKRREVALNAVSVRKARFSKEELSAFGMSGYLKLSPEQRASNIAALIASNRRLSPEERSALAKRRIANTDPAKRADATRRSAALAIERATKLTPEQRLAMIAPALAGIAARERKQPKPKLSPEERSTLAKNRWASMPPERRAEICRKRSASMKRRAATSPAATYLSPEDRRALASANRSAKAKQRWASMTPERRAEVRLNQSIARKKVMQEMPAEKWAETCRKASISRRARRLTKAHIAD